MVKTTNLTKLRHAEFYEILKLICESLNEREIPDRQVKEVMQMLMQELETFGKNITYRKEVELTPELRAIHKRRTAAYRALAGQVRSLKQLPVAQIADTAAELYALIEGCGKYPYRKPEIEVAGLMKALVERLRQEYSDHIRTLGLQLSVDCLKELNEEYDRMCNEWMTVKEERQEHKALPQRKVVQALFRRLCDMVNAGIVWREEHQVYEGMARVINEGVKKARWALKHRMAMRKKEDGDTEVDAGAENEEQDDCGD